MMSKWQALKARKMTPAQIEKVNKEVADEQLQMDLRELRQTLGITQNEMANLLKKAQPEISRLEHRSDFHVSTMERYVSALCGELEIVAALETGACGSGNRLPVDEEASNASKGVKIAAGRSPLLVTAQVHSRERDSLLGSQFLRVRLRASNPSCSKF